MKVLSRETERMLAVPEVRAAHRKALESGTEQRFTFEGRTYTVKPITFPVGDDEGSWLAEILVPLGALAFIGWLIAGAT